MRTTVASGKRNGRKMGAGGAPATGLMRLRAPEPAAVGRAQAAAGAGRQPPPSCPTAAGKRDPTSGGRTLGTRRRWSCEPAWGRRGRPSSPEMISSVDHAKMLVYMVILDQKACRGACGGVNNTRGEEGGDWRAEEWAAKRFERTLFGAPTPPSLSKKMLQRHASNLHTHAAWSSAAQQP